MKRRSLANDLIDEFSPTPLREMGVFAFERKADGPQAPRICEQGPCIHYHRLETQMDVAAPQDGTAAGLFTQVHHACYPDTGIEIELGDTPVLECNRWEPMTPALKTKLKRATKQHFKTKDGKQFLKELWVWVNAKAQQQSEIEKAAAEEAEKLAAEERERAASQTDNQPTPTDGPFNIEPFGGAS